MRAILQQTGPGADVPASLRRPGGLLALVLLTLSIVWQPGSARSEDSGADRIDNTRAALEKWVETRRVLAQRKREWALAQELLAARIDLVKGESDSLREKIAQAKDSITEADTKRAELIEENDKFKNASSALSDTVLGLETRTKGLLKRLPPPIMERVKPLSQRIPDDPAETKLSLAERFQNVVGILNEINKFNREITVTSEVRPLDDGTSVEVTAIYVGIGQGYYVNGQATVAGVGTAGPDGWVWQPATDAAERIASIVAILKNEQVAAFVDLPVDIR